MVGERDGGVSPLERASQQHLLIETRRRVFKMLGRVEGMSAEAREGMAVRVAQFVLGASKIPVFDKAIFLYFPRDREISDFHIVQFVTSFPKPDPMGKPKSEEEWEEERRITEQLDGLFALSKRFLWSCSEAGPMIYSTKKLSDGISTEAYMRSMPSAIFLGELNAVRV